MDTNIFLKEGHVVWIDEPLKSFYRIVRREPFEYETGAEDTAVFSTVASGGTSGFKNIEQLEPDDKPLHLFQVLWGVQDGPPIKYYVKIPSGQNRFGTDEDKEIGFINCEKSPHTNPNPLFQFWLITQWYPTIDCHNNSPVTITPKVWFCGMKYDLEKIEGAAELQAIKAANRFKRIHFGGVKNTP